MLGESDDEEDEDYNLYLSDDEEIEDPSIHDNPFEQDTDLILNPLEEGQERDHNLKEK